MTADVRERSIQRGRRRPNIREESEENEGKRKNKKILPPARKGGRPTKQIGGEERANKGRNRKME